MRPEYSASQNHVAETVDVRPERRAMSDKVQPRQGLQFPGGSLMEPQIVKFGPCSGEKLPCAAEFFERDRSAARGALD